MRAVLRRAAQITEIFKAYGEIIESRRRARTCGSAHEYAPSGKTGGQPGHSAPPASAALECPMPDSRRVTMPILYTYTGPPSILRARRSPCSASMILRALRAFDLPLRCVYNYTMYEKILRMKERYRCRTILPPSSRNGRKSGPTRKSSRLRPTRRRRNFTASKCSPIRAARSTWATCATTR